MQLTVLSVVITGVVFFEDCRGQPRDSPGFSLYPENTTISVGAKTKLRCRVEGYPNPNVTWTHNGATIAVNQDKRYRIHRIGSLRISAVSLADEGWYRCVAANKHGRAATEPVYLDVQADATITEGPPNASVSWGSLITVNCTATGKPSPHISWLKNNKPLIDHDTGKVYTAPSLEVNVTENTTYECTAQNLLNHGVITVTWKGTLSYIEDTRPAGYCASLEEVTSNSVCAAYMTPQHPKNRIFLNTSHSNPQKAAEELLVYVFDNVLNNLAFRCRESVKRLLCNTLYPQCQGNGTEVKATPVCRSSCLQVEGSACSREWSNLQAEFSNLRSQMPAGAEWGDLQPISCQELPEDGCTRLNMSLRHSHAVSMPEPIQLRELSSTDQEATLFSPSFTVIMLISGAVCLTLVIIIVCFSYHLIKKRRYTDYLRPLGHEMTKRNVSVKMEKLTENSFYHQRLPSCSSDGSYGLRAERLTELEYPRNHIVYIDGMGQGAFGQMFKASAKFIRRGQLSEREVVVKTLWDSADIYMEDDMIKEADLMCQLDHPNIIKLLGVCLQDKPMCLLYEYMCEGDLTEFLRIRSPQYHSVTDVTSDSNSSCGDSSGQLKKPQLVTTEQLDIALQIASAMAYLAERGYIHSDLATRNCLVGDNMTVKISDFALMRNSHRGNYVRGADYDPVPVRWMSPEAVFDNKYSPASDVWSFGVVLWEIFSLGMQPYYELQSLEAVMQHLRSGRVLERPMLPTPDRVYSLMCDCWQTEPKHRPPFTQVYSRLKELRQQLRYSCDFEEVIVGDNGGLENYCQENEDEDVFCKV